MDTYKNENPYVADIYQDPLSLAESGIDNAMRLNRYVIQSPESWAITNGS